jgi:hypothetical protein
VEENLNAECVVGAFGPKTLHVVRMIGSGIQVFFNRYVLHLRHLLKGDWENGTKVFQDPIAELLPQQNYYISQVAVTLFGVFDCRASWGFTPTRFSLYLQGHLLTSFDWEVVFSSFIYFITYSTNSVSWVDDCEIL